ncbi:hypothetical protein DIE14_15250 [Burkholderia sp. Bp9017]|uniref:Uncharacterized protein n=1 Tax=Burkholderia anthina TaxID=179879 RepID=A0A7T7AI55_9BURK|nr:MULTISPECIES: hypothetical protein [Burkholderia]QQK03510.1 hypothetical protein JFN94_04910 [Burkholderia anthina]RQZ26023.1 hypothetical protein DIE14_15250 [Burkholderia sp. Bp9017]RQZ33904.1 hypothetical protein DIE13_15160 [Burkholderia sp. Bp9016]
MKPRNDIRFATTGPALRRAARAPRVLTGMATGLSAVARGRLPLRRVVPSVAAPVTIATAIAAQPAGRHVPAVLAAALVGAIAARNTSGFAPVPVEHRRRVRAPAAPSILSRARRRPFSSVRLTLMQDHSS